ncbi:extracellular solute-binding protein [Natrialbaceae archaeon A-CW3]
MKYLAGASAAGALAGCISTEEPDDGNGNGDGNGDGNGGSEDYEEDEDWPTVEPQEGVDGEADIYHSLSEGERDDFEGNIDSFNDSYEATIRPNEVAELEETITADIPAGEGPEIHLWAHDWVGRDYEAGFLSDQTDRLQIDLDEYFVPGAAESVQYDGSIVGLPHAAETVSLIYNKDYVDEPPETFEEMREIMDEHHDPGGEGTYGLSYPLDPYFYSSWVHGFGGYYYDDDSGELGLTNDESIEGFDFIKEELYDQYMAADWEYDAQASVFMEGNAPFAFNGPWFVGDVDFEVGVAPWPEVDGHTPSPYTGIQVLYFTAEMEEDDDRADAATAFAEWYTTNTSIVAQMADQHGYIPVHQAFVEDDEEADELPENVQGFAQAVEQGVPMPTSPEMNQVWEPVEEEFIAVLNENKSTAEAMADAEERIRDAWD